MTVHEDVLEVCQQDIKLCHIALGYIHSNPVNRTSQSICLPAVSIHDLNDLPYVYLPDVASCRKVFATFSLGLVKAAIKNTSAPLVQMFMQINNIPLSCK